MDKQERHKSNILILYKLDKQIEKVKSQMEGLQELKKNLLRDFLYDCDLTKYNEFMKLRELLITDFKYD